MTITTWADALADDIRASADPSDPVVRLALQFAVQVWHQAANAHDSAVVDTSDTETSGMRYGMFACAVQLVIAELYTQPQPTTIIIDPDVLRAPDAVLRAVKTVVGAAADLFAAHTTGPQRWRHATAANELRQALHDLP